MDDYKSRLKFEKAELDSKIQRLKVFIDGNTFQLVTAAEQRRLRRQEVIMGLYADVLDERILAIPVD